MFDYGDLAEAGAFSTPLVYEPVSRIMAGGFSTGRPAQVAVLGVDLEWDDESEMVWDNDDDMGWA
jgi:hypothetical protein